MSYIEPSLPQAGSDELLHQVAQRFHNDPIFHARCHLAWNYAGVQSYDDHPSGHGSTVGDTLRSAIVTALHVDDLLHPKILAALN